MESEARKTDEAFMQRCLRLAGQAKRNGKTAVGSLIVLNDKIIAEGCEGEDAFPAPLAHAEIVAILKAYTHLDSKNLSECILYTTVEPCFMCSYLIRTSALRRVVYGAVAGETGGASSNYPILSSQSISIWQPIMVEGGVLAEQCAQLLRGK